MLLQLLNATLIDGSSVDVLVDGDRISAVSPAGSPSTTGSPVTAIDLSGYLLTPAFVEPHAHLDKALTADLVHNPSGDLMGAIDAWLDYRTTITKTDFVERATAAAMLGVANGCTAIRTHVDVGPDIGTTGVEALIEVRAALAPVVELQLVALTGGFTGPVGTETMAVMRAALELGVDVVGGVPHHEAEPERAIEMAFELAAEFERPVDLHAEEVLNPAAKDLELMGERVLATGFTHPVTASHCVSLGMKPESEQQRVSELTAEAGIDVIALPQTNLYLQAREATVAPPRGLTAIGPLERAGANVAAGGDNLQDPFCIVGRGDPMETASLLVMAGHLSAASAYAMVSDRARLAMGLEPVAVAAGSPAELVAIPAPSLRQAVAVGPPGRLVIHAGKVVGGTSAND